MNTNVVDVIKSLENIISLNSASDTDIVRAELELRVSFAEDYKSYLTAFGAVIGDGFELTGITKAAHRNVVEVTKQEWHLNSKVPHSMYVIENTHIDSIIIWQDKSGKVYKTIAGEEPKYLASSLVDYINLVSNK